MKVITIIEEGERPRSVYVRADGDVTVFDRDRKFRFRTDIAGAETTWQILARVVPTIVHAETVRLKIEAFADRCRTGWRPGYPDEIDPDIPQRTLRRARLGVDLLRYPDDDEVLQPGDRFDGNQRERPSSGDRRDHVDRRQSRVGDLRGFLLVDASRMIKVTMR
ncbi:hypothetical protein V1290_005648 [Bradyrhizobium sp. AZCC 1578]|uniref:hypothetical protein n=1 Tax=unclassified Bradyrhizobium TaxID=2631580 RepID=UPI002FEEFAB4